MSKTIFLTATLYFLLIFNGGFGDEVEAPPEVIGDTNSSNEDDLPVIKPSNVKDGNRASQADKNEENLFIVVNPTDNNNVDNETENQAVILKIRNHSRLPIFFSNALVRDQLFVIHEKSIELKELEEDPTAERSSLKLFKAIRQTALSYYSTALDDLYDNSEKQQNQKKLVLNALIALQYVNTFGQVLDNTIEVLDKILSNFNESKPLRQLFFHFDEFPRLKRRHKIVKRKRLMISHKENKYKSFYDEILKRIPQTVKDKLGNVVTGRNAVPKIEFVDLQTELPADNGNPNDNVQITDNVGKDDTETESNNDPALQDSQ